MNTAPQIAVDDPGLRLAALAAYRVLDTPEERDFDDIVLVAAQVCGAPIALMTLIDRDRQWFKARLGVEARETPIAQSLCAHAMRAGAPLVIEDLAEDPRTRDNILVAGPASLRFYAGAPLVTPQGVAIGALCVMDRSPRPGGLSDAQAQALEVLARQTVAQLELRRAAGAVQGEATRLRLAEEVGRIGAFAVDAASGITTVSAQFCRLFGLPTAPTYALAELDDLILDEAGLQQTSDLTRAAGEGPSDAEYRIRRRGDGAVRWIHRRAEFARDDAGRVTAMYGAMLDITDRREGERRRDALLTLGEGLRDCADPREIGFRAAQTLGETLGGGAAAFGAISNDGEVLTVERDWTTPGAPSIAGAHRMRDYGAFGEELRQGRMVVVHDAVGDPRAAAGLSSLNAAGARAFISVPVMEHHRLTALISINGAGPRVWEPGEVAFAQAVADLAYTARARVLAEAEQRMLNQEIGHRLKNSLAMVQTLARQTLRDLADRGPVEAFEARLQALGAAHDLLLGESWDAADMSSVVKTTLMTLAPADRFTLSGPSVRLSARAVLSLSLVLHEMATNAAKYGAFADDDGRVGVAWEIVGPELVFRWREHGGPPVTPPARTSFGSRLIRLGLAGAGEVDLRYPPAGFEADMRAPLDRLRDS